MQIFKVKGVARFTRRQRIADESLREAIERAGRGAIDADLGGGLIKQRVARPGQGRSGGFRMIVAYRAAGRAVFLYGFAKNERHNIDDDELEDLRAIGANWLAASAGIIRQALADGDLQEIEYDHNEETQPPPA
ncbi:MAG: type II toxin-antitoxin system RelE/ParE family toxin [Azonexus sp.]|nr:type II toxin-antitoxin system RelE/ParE family toxin [Azonexus sp.]